MYKYALLFAKCNTLARLEDRFHELLRVVKYNYRDASSPIFAEKNMIFHGISLYQGSTESWKSLSTWLLRTHGIKEFISLNEIIDVVSGSMRPPVT